MMWQFDNRTCPRHAHAACPARRRRRCCERDERYMSPSYTRVYPLVVRARQRRGHRGRGRQPLPRLHRRHRRHRDRALPSRSRRRHPGPGGQAAAHVGHRLLLRSRRSTWPSGWPSWRPGQSPKRVFFTNSGAEALEAALKLARWHTGRSRAIAFFGAFHGRTYGAMSLSGSKLVHRRGFSPLVPDIHHVPFPRGCTACATPDAAAPASSRSRRRCSSASPRRTRWRPSSSSRSRARAATTCRRRASCRRCASCATGTASCWSPTRCRRGMGRTGKMFAVRALGRRAGHHLPGQGHRQRHAARGDRRPGDVMDWPPRQPRQHLRRQPGQLPGRPGDARPARARVHRQRRRSAASSCAAACDELQRQLPARRRRARPGADDGGGRRHGPTTARPDPACATPSSRRRSSAACCCWAAARAPSASARRCAYRRPKWRRRSRS